MRLFIAEKPDLARAIVDGLSDGNAGNQTKGNGFIKVGNDTVTWCFGHLLALKNPDEYDEKYKKWEMHSLPFDIPKLELKPIKGKENQVKIIKDLVKKATEIVNAGDPDEEGQLLVDELLEYFNNKKPVKRVLNLHNLLTFKGVIISLIVIEKKRVVIMLPFL
jgi:DNA topoisomerase-3